MSLDASTSRAAPFESMDRKTTLSSSSGVTVELVGAGMYLGAEGLLLMELERPERPTSTTISWAVEKLGVHKLRALRIVERSGRFPIDPQQPLEDTDY